MDRHFQNGRGGEEANKADASVIVDLTRQAPGKSAAAPHAADPPIDLPAPSHGRWTPRGKAAVIEALERGVIDHDDACRQYDLTIEEIELWRRRYKTSGLAGLMVTRVSGARRRDRSTRAAV